MRRAQIAMEYLVISGFAVFVLIALLSTVVYTHSQAQESVSAQQADEIAQQIQQEIAIASSVHDGYVRTFTLPERIQQEPYSIQLFSDAVHVTASQTAIRRVPPANGTIIAGQNQIRKTNGEVRINS